MNVEEKLKYLVKSIIEYDNYLDIIECETNVFISTWFSDSFPHKTK